MKSNSGQSATLLFLIMQLCLITGSSVSAQAGPGCTGNIDCPGEMECSENRCVSLPPLEPCLVDTGCECYSSDDCYQLEGPFAEQGGFCNFDLTCVSTHCDSDLGCSFGGECSHEGRCVVDVSADRDRDGVPDGTGSQRRDNCPIQANTGQEDFDRDGFGDVCDDDDDDDGVADSDDNCPYVVNPDQLDREDNGVGDACEGFRDRDGDGVPDHIDNCTFNAFGGGTDNPDQRDTDRDGIGDRCDVDDDNDGNLDISDPCPITLNIACFMDSDGDGLADAEDEFRAPIDLGERTGGRILGNNRPGSNQPPDPIGFTAYVPENTGGTLLGLVLVSDPNEGDTHTFAIIGGNVLNLFAIDQDGEVSTTGSLNFEVSPQHILTVSVTDSGGLTDTADVIVNVENVNEQPHVADATFFIDENTAASQLGTISATDPEDDDLTYNLISGNSSGFFTIDSKSGVLSTTIPLDYESGSLYSLTVQATDPDGLSGVGLAKVSVIDENEASGNASLASLTLSEGTLTPAFAVGTSSYKATVDNSITSVTVLATAENINASADVNSSGSSSSAVTLAVGDNPIDVVVTAEDGTTTQTYTVTVTRSPIIASTNSDLFDLVLSDATLDQTFQASQLSYTATVSFSVTATTVTATTDDANATVTVNGAAVISGSPSAPIALSEGLNTIRVVVIAEDGTATTSYTAEVSRQSGSGFAQQAYIKASTRDPGDNFGFSVSLSDDTLVVGAPTEDSTASGGESNNSAIDAGAVYVFTRSSGAWTQQAYLKASNASGGGRFGWSVSVSGDTLAIGAAFDLQRTGAVYLFTRTADVWAEQAIIKASNAGTQDRFGWSLDLSGDTLVVGAIGEASSASDGEADNSSSGAGAAYVFTRTLDSWTQQAYIKASNAEAGDNFGGAVALSGDTLAVSAPGEASSADGGESDNNASLAGAVYVYTRSGGVWSQQAYLKASNAESADQFGNREALSLQGDTLAVGAFSEDSNGSGESDNSAKDAGAAYVFTRTGSVWSQQAYLKASNTGTPDFYGLSISLGIDTLAVGAINESSSAAGGESDNSVIAAGAVYIYTRDSGVWTQQIILKASNAGSSDFFGTSVAISGGTVAASAGNEDSGFLNTESDNSATDSGAAYVFQ